VTIPHVHKEIQTPKELTLVLLGEAAGVYAQWFKPGAVGPFADDIRQKLELIRQAVEKVKEWED